MSFKYNHTGTLDPNAKYIEFALLFGGFEVLFSSMKSTDLRMSQLTNQLTETPSSWSCVVILVVLQYFGSCSSVGLPGQLVFRRGHHWSLMSLLWTSAWAAPFASQESLTRGENSEGKQAFHRFCLMCLRQACLRRCSSALSPVSPTSASLKVFLWSCLLCLPLERRTQQ